MSKIEVPVSQGRRFINFGPVVLVTASHEQKSNIVTLAWVTPVSVSPPLVGICVSSSKFSHKLIQEGRQFAINIPTKDIIEAVKVCGSVSGKDADKFEKAKLTREKARRISAPLIKECAAHIECKLFKSVELGDHYLFVGEVVACSCEDGFLKPDGIVDTIKFDVVTHLGGKSFAILKKM
ncbi:flavin reductase family protein [Candidatus Margulisiibacteriota bacterium]